MEHRRQRDHLGQQPGPLRPARSHGGNTRRQRVPVEDHSHGDRRRLRGQGTGRLLPGASGRGPLPQVRAAREGGHVPRRGVRGHRPHLGQPHPCQAGRHPRRQAHGRGLHAGLRGGGVSRLAGAIGLPHHAGAIRGAQQLHRGHRRGGKHTEGGGLSGTRISHGRFRRRVGYRRDLRPDRDGPRGVPASKRGQGGQPPANRPGVPKDRVRGNPAGCPGASAPGRAADRPPDTVVGASPPARGSTAPGLPAPWPA